MADAVQKPTSGWRVKADERAFETKNFVLGGDLPGTASTLGKVDWGDGKTLTHPLISSKQAYESFALNRSAGPHLTVTGARLGRTTIVTSRGKAAVPAWLFRLEGYDTPLKRVAVTPSKRPKPPIGPARQGTDGGLRSVARLVGTAADGRSVTVRATHGSCDGGPAVRALQDRESVVLYASIKEPESGACTAEIIEQDVKVTSRGPSVTASSWTLSPVVPCRSGTPGGRRRAGRERTVVQPSSRPVSPSLHHVPSTCQFESG
ncbi:hypothetical protein ACWDCL_14280 [Streptomyces sp. NPDC001009]